MAKPRKAAASKAPAVRGAGKRPLARTADNGLDLGTGGGYGTGLRAIFDPQTGLGTDMRYTRFSFPRVLDMYELTALGMDGIPQRILTYPVAQALACGYEIVMSADVAPELRDRLLTAAMDKALRLRTDSRVGALGTRARWYGDAVLAAAFVSDAGAGALATPPAWGQRVRWLTVWDQRDWYPASYESVDSARYRQAGWLRLMLGRPELESERWQGWRGGEAGTVALHPGRYVRLHTASGFSILQHIAPYIVGVLSAAQGTNNLIQRAGLGHFRIDGWEEMVRARGGDAQDLLAAQYASTTQFGFVVTNGVDTRKTEDYEQKTTSLAGIDLGVYVSLYLLSGASGIPLSRIMGTSPGAFQSGEVQDQMWYEYLAELQAWLEPALHWAWDAHFAEVLGQARAPEYEIRWNSPKKVSTLEAVQERTAALEAAIKGMSAQLLSPAAAAATLNSEAPASFQFAPVEAPAPAAATAAPADPAEAAALAPDVGADQLSDVALNGAQVQSLVSIATDPILTPEAKQAIITASFPTVPAGLVKIIAAGGAAAIASAPRPGPGLAPSAPATTPQGAAQAAEEPAAAADAEPEGPDPADLWRTAEEIAAQYGSIKPGHLKKRAASAPGVTEPGRLTWIKPGAKRMYKLSEVRAAFEAGGGDLDPGTPDGEDAPADDTDE